MDLRFFVTGHGRSGTLWLARLLNRCAPTVNVHHEPLAQFDAARYTAAYERGAPATERWLRLRITRMERVWERHPDQGYAEVNSYLRYCVPRLREVFGVPVVALVRDGRYVVRSMLARGCYKRDGYPPIQPPQSMSPFAACCWYWADTYRRLITEGVKFWRLEDLNTRVEAFGALCDEVGVEADRTVWKQCVGRRVNVDVGDVPLDWDAQHVAAFEMLAGDVQKFFDYPMEGE